MKGVVSERGRFVVCICKQRVLFPVERAQQSTASFCLISLQAVGSKWTPTAVVGYVAEELDLIASMLAACSGLKSRPRVGVLMETCSIALMYMVAERSRACVSEVHPLDSSCIRLYRLVDSWRFVMGERVAAYGAKRFQPTFSRMFHGCFSASIYSGRLDIKEFRQVG